MKLVINKCFGGFGLSHKALKYVVEHGGEVQETPLSKWMESSWENDFEDEFTEDIGDGYRGHRSFGVIAKGDTVYSYDGYTEEHRSNPVLVEAVEKMGHAASGQCAKLKVVEVPDGVDFHIHEYDGQESIHEKHRTWG